MKKNNFVLALITFCLLSCKTINNSYEIPSDTKTEAFGEKPSLIRQPYLQMVRAKTATITWKTNAITKNCFVEIKEKENPNKIIIDGKLEMHEGLKFNEVILNNLKSETTYEYAIYSNGHLLAKGEDYYFTTAPDNKTTAFSFYALGDIGAKEKQSFAKEPATRITELKTKPDFGLGLGDIVYPKGESKNYDNHLFKPFQEVFRNTPFYPVAGNHDWLSDPEKNFEKEWRLPNNEHYYSFSFSNTLFIGLDSSNGGFYNVEEQVDWLEQMLKEKQNKYSWMIVYLHHNGKSCTYKKDYDHVKKLYKLFADNNVDLVLNGHAHTYERLKPYDKNGNVDVLRANEKEYRNLKNRFVSVTIGAGGKINKKWKADPNNPENCEDGNIVAYAEHVPSFGLVSINSTTLKFEAYNSFTGNVIDSFTIQK